MNRVTSDTAEWRSERYVNLHVEEGEIVLAASAHYAAVTRLPLLLLAVINAGSVSAQAYVSVQVNNLTHPDLAPNLLAGDTYQYVVSGPPNEPVYNVQNSEPMTQVGQTDGNGTLSLPESSNRHGSVTIHNFGTWVPCRLLRL